nr:MAK10-like protein [Tanacetum cinerariifolium]
MRDENHIPTLGDYSKPSHEGYRNDIELPVGNNVIPSKPLLNTHPRVPMKWEVSGIFKPEQNNFGDTYNPSWKSHPNLRWRQPQNPLNNFSNPPNWFQPNGSIQNHFFNNNPRSFNNQSNLKGLVSNFMASQDARLSKFEADFKQQQREMTNKIDTVLKAITNQITGALPSNTVKNPKLSTSLVLSARSYSTIDLQCSSHPSTSINAIKAHSKEANISQTSLLWPGIEIEMQQPKEPKPTLKDEFHILTYRFSKS